ncbi:hypothetical protein DOTSEDRAFT_99043, partial [Dothistroma septosporum NZE10]
MTIPVVRVRAKHSKTRTGCRTCRLRHVKCDEERPSCRACNRAGRVCAGYDHVPSSTQSLGPRRLEPLMPRPLFTPLVSLRDHESISLDFFRLFTINKLPQRTWWQHIVLDLSKQEPVLAHAATALGSMHRAIALPGDSKELSINTNQRQIATDQYTKAVASMRRYIDGCFQGNRILSHDQLVVVLSACLLFFCFEAYVSHDKQATLHLRTGLRILYEQRRDVNAALSRDEGDRVITTRATMRTYLDALTYTFVLLDNDLNMVDEEEPYLTTICLDKMPSAFSCIQVAQIHLDFLAQRANDVYRILLTSCETYFESHPELCEGLDDDVGEFHLGCMSRLFPLDSDDEFWHEHNVLRQDLREWLCAFATVQVSQENRSEHLLVQVYFFYVWFRTETWRDGTEIQVDRFGEQFKHITDLAEQYLAMHTDTAQYVSPADEGANQVATVSSTPPLFSFGSGFVTAVMLIAIKCRISSIRQRCVAIVRAVNLQGFFDSAFLAAYLQAIVQLEEERSRGITGCIDSAKSFEAAEVPEAARLFEPMMLPGRQAEETDFYRSDSGHMIY